MPQKFSIETIEEIIRTFCSSSNPEKIYNIQKRQNKIGKIFIKNKEVKYFTHPKLLKDFKRVHTIQL